MSIKSNNDTKFAYQRIVDQIKNMIVEGELVPGDKLLSERKLAEKMKVSRTVVREALKTLNSLGFIETNPGGGNYIKEADLENLLDPFAARLTRNKQNVIYLMEARRIIESASVKLASERATESDLYKIRDDAFQIKEDIENGEPADEADIKFHKDIVEASANPVLSELISLITNLMRKYYLPYRHFLLNEGDSGNIYAEQHIKIYEAIKNRDGKKASKIMNKHLTQAQKEIMMLLKEKNINPRNKKEE